MSSEPASLAAPAAIVTESRVSTKSSSQKPHRFGGSVWWRHALGVVALIWALFPVFRPH